MRHPQEPVVGVDIGLEPGTRAPIVDGLSRVLADSFALYLKTHHYHWNVTGPMFTTLHTLFETQYSALWLALDKLAERIRALGAPAPGSLATLTRLTDIQDDEVVPPAMEMVRQLLAGHETIVRGLRGLVPHCESAGDVATMDLLTDRIAAHEKDAWMLRSLLA